MAVRTGPTADRWSAERRGAFLQALALTSNVAASERAAEMPRGSAYKERNRDPEFAEAWVQALRQGYDQLEIKLLERALKGQRVNRRNKDGKVIGYDTEFSERLALQLLGAHRQTVRGVAAAGGVAETDAAFQKRLAAKIDALRKVRRNG